MVASRLIWSTVTVISGSLARQAGTTSGARTSDRAALRLVQKPLGDGLELSHRPTLLAARARSRLLLEQDTARRALELPLLREAGRRGLRLPHLALEAG